MSSIADFKRKTRGIHLKRFVQAVDAYTSQGHPVPSGMKANPGLYAELAERYLYWTGKVLAIVQDAAYQRPHLKVLADQLLELAPGFFEQESRWPPTDPALRHPLTLIGPAYYASRIGELLNSLVKPQLVQVDYTWANEFAKEVLGSHAVKEIKELVKRDTDAILKAAAEADLRSTGHRPRDIEPFLDDDQRHALRQARTAPSTPPPTPERTPSPTPTHEQQAVLKNLTSLLQGKVLRRQEAQVGGGVSGVISMVEKKHALFLHPDGSFLYEERTFTSVTSGGFTVPSEETRTGEGRWSVELVEGNPALVLRQNGEVARWWHVRDGGPGIQYLDGEAWNRY